MRVPNLGSRAGLRVLGLRFLSGFECRDEGLEGLGFRV